MDRQIKRPSDDNQNRIGIFGSNGFIGKNLCSALHLQNIRFDVFEGNSLNKSHVEEFFDNSNARNVIFLIGSFYPPLSNLIEKNLLTLQTVLEVGVNKALRKIIYVSSGAVYGNTGDIESVETDPLLPVSLYGLTKKYCEECIHYYEVNYGIKGIILRFPNVYGDGNTKGVVYEFLNRIANKQKVIIDSDGKQGRNFLHISDAVTALLKTLSIQNNEVFNVTNNRKISLNNLISMMHDYKQIDVIYDQSRNIPQYNIYMNISKCAKKLHFIPTYDIDTYIRQKLS